MAKRVLWLAGMLLCATSAIAGAGEQLTGQGREITLKGLSLLCINKAQDSPVGALLAGPNPERMCTCTAEKVTASLSKEDVIAIIGGEVKVKDDPRLKGMLEQAALSCLKPR
ncbi:hypothetical protein QU481_00190 [Crenobacter sp. SG2303]|uniref:Secreted protein n=1 Tax=Crenobacter oryzisoli TaxID=3056844 RepID=A0ABT7XHR1_9NEIS|nr:MULTISPECIES: hypothetical protein [unclassified Crenobacter]MDN0073318.1 hypothetical protein [Crenobacter sp. SG2303]MDN0084399.1 hypothetical protein [Crenobacter sp. SG2305]